MSDDLTARLLGEQRKRLVASIMGAAENSPWWGKLTQAERSAYRDKVLSSIGTYYDFCRDVIKVTGEDSMRNDLAIDLLQQVHDGQVALERQLRTSRVA